MPLSIACIEKLVEQMDLAANPAVQPHSLPCLAEKHVAGYGVLRPKGRACQRHSSFFQYYYLFSFICGGKNPHSAIHSLEPPMLPDDTANMVGPLLALAKERVTEIKLELEFWNALLSRAINGNIPVHDKSASPAAEAQGRADPHT